MELQQVLNGWFATYGATHGTVDSVLRVSDDTWSVLTQDAGRIDATLDVATSRIGLICDLGVPGETGREAVLEGLLNYSALWRMTGGVRAALAADGTALLIVELHLPDLSEDGLHRALENMTAKALALTAFVKGESQPMDDSNTMIRL